MSASKTIGFGGDTSYQEFSQTSDSSHNPSSRFSFQQGLRRNIASTDRLIDFAGTSFKDRPVIQQFFDGLSIDPSMLKNQISAGLRLGLAKQYIVSAKEFLEKSDFQEANRWERIASRTIQQADGDFLEYEEKSLERGEKIAAGLVVTGASLFALGVTAVLAAAALPGVMALASQGIGGAFLGWGGIAMGAGSGLSLASVGKRWIESLVGGEEKALDDRLMAKDFTNGAYLSSFQFFAPFAGALGQSWAQVFSGLSKEAIQLLPFSLLQGGHGSAQTLSEGGSVKEAALAGGLGAALPFFFHGMEKVFSIPQAIQDRLSRTAAIELYDGLRAAEGTPLEEAIQTAQKKFGLTPQNVKTKIEDLFLQHHPDNGGGPDTFIELCALRDILTNKNSQLAKDYLAGKIKISPAVETDSQTIQQDVAATSTPESKTKIEVVDLSTQPDVAPSKPKSTDMAPPPAWKVKAKVTDQGSGLAGQILNRGGTPTSAPAQASFSFSQSIGALDSSSSSPDKRDLATGGETPPQPPGQPPDKFKRWLFDGALLMKERISPPFGLFGDIESLIDLGFVMQRLNKVNEMKSCFEGARSLLASVRLWEGNKKYYNSLRKKMIRLERGESVEFQYKKEEVKEILENVQKGEWFEALGFVNERQSASAFVFLTDLFLKREFPAPSSDPHASWALGKLSVEKAIVDEYYEVFSTNPNQPTSGILRPWQEGDPLKAPNVWTVESIEGDLITLTQEEGKTYKKEGTRDVITDLDVEKTFRIAKGKSGTIDLKPGNRVIFVPEVKGGSGKRWRSQ